MLLWCGVHIAVTQRLARAPLPLPLQVRKAYKQLALQLHPDKNVSACHYSARLSEQVGWCVGALHGQGELWACRAWGGRGLASAGGSELAQ